jgi:hypothetical protein
MEKKTLEIISYITDTFMLKTGKNFLDKPIFERYYFHNAESANIGPKESNKPIIK